MQINYIFVGLRDKGDVGSNFNFSEVVLSEDWPQLL